MQCAITHETTPCCSKSFDHECLATTSYAFAYNVGNGISDGASLAADTLVHYLLHIVLWLFVLLMVVIGLIGIKFINHY